AGFRRTSGNYSRSRGKENEVKERYEPSAGATGLIWSEGRPGIGSHEGCTACGHKRSADLMRCSDVGVWHGKRAGQGYSQSGAVAAAHQGGGTGHARQRVIWA